MANSKRPPLELDDLTNNLKQSSGKGMSAFFSDVPQNHDPALLSVSEADTNTLKKSAGIRPALNVESRSQKHASPTLNLAEKPEKYTTHLEPSLKKRLQRFALDRDLNDYDVVRLAVIEYLDRNE